MKVKKKKKERRTKGKIKKKGKEKKKRKKKKKKRKKKKKENKNRRKTRKVFVRVSVLCSARNFRSRTNQTMDYSYVWMSGYAYESSLSMSRLVYRLNSTSTVLWQCGWSGTNTPPDDGGLTPPDVLPSCQRSALSHSRMSRFNTFKQFVLVLRDPHLLWTYIVLHMLKTMHTVWIKTQTVSRLRIRIYSETHSISGNYTEFAQVISQNYSGRSIQVHHVVTFIDVSRFSTFYFTKQCPVRIRLIVDSLPYFINSFPNSFVSLPNSAWLCFIRILDPFWHDFLTSDVKRSPTQSTRLVLNQFYCCCICRDCWKSPKIPNRLLLLLLTVLHRNNPSGYSSSRILHNGFPSFVVVIVAAIISDQHVLTIHGFCVPTMVSWVYPLDSALLQ